MGGAGGWNGKRRPVQGCQGLAGRRWNWMAVDVLHLRLQRGRDIASSDTASSCISRAAGLSWQRLTAWQMHSAENRTRTQPNYARTDLMNCVMKSTIVLTFALILTAGRSYAAPSIVGDTVDIYSVAQSSGSEFLSDTVQVVDPGVEYTATILNTDIYDLNIGPTSIQLITLSDWYSPWFNSGYPPSSLQIRDIDVPGMPGLSIGGVSVTFSDTIVPEPNAPLNYPAFSAANVSYTANSVMLEIGPYSFPTGARVQIDLTFVPEPGMASLLGCGLLCVLTALRSRSRKRQFSFMCFGAWCL
jgi:hypothetical protein